MHGLRSEDDVDLWCAAEDFLAVSRRDAAADTDDHPGISLLELLPATELVVDLLLGVLTHRAGVEENDVGRLSLGNFLIAIRREEICEPLRVIDVHLAAPGVDIELHFFSSHSFPAGPARSSFMLCQET